MYRYAFPTCPVVGSQAPEPYNHLFSGAVPSKCRSCQSLFEGGCVRNFNTVGMYQNLHHGACPIPGSTEPVERFDESLQRLVFVPRKCTKCEYLKNDAYRGYVCLHQQEIWKSFPRSLDWGDWEPESDPIGIDGKVVITTEVRALIANGRTARATAELKRLYPGVPTHIALQYVSIFKERIEASS